MPCQKGFTHLKFEIYGNEDRVDRGGVVENDGQGSGAGISHHTP